MIRVVLADDHPVYLDGLSGLLATVDEVEVVGTATDGAAAVETVAALRLHVADRAEAIVRAREAGLGRSS